MLTTLIAILRAVLSAFRSHRDLAIENLALRQQLAIYKRTVRRAKIKISDRVLWVTLHRFWSGWRDVLIVVKPEISVTFRPIYVWFAIEHARRRILHVNATEHPTAAWLVQQLREAFPFNRVPRYLIFDRDSIFSAEVARAAKAMGMEPIGTAFASPWQNGVAERWISSARRDVLDHAVILDVRHLLRWMREYVRYHHVDRTHLGLAKDTPAGRAVEHRPAPGDRVVALPRLGGMHHRYEWREAA